MRNIGKMPPSPTIADAVQLRRAISALTRRMRAQDDAGDIGSTGFGILGSLQRWGTASASELAQLERLQPQSLTRALRALVKDRLIARTAAANDRRRAVLTLTAKGEAHLRAAMRKRVTWLARTMETQLDAGERETLRAAASLLERIADAGEPATPSDAVFNLIPYAQVADVERSRQFYERLGFVEDGRVQSEGRPIWISMHARTVRAARIMLARAGAPMKLDEQSIFFYCWTDDVVALHERLTREGITVGNIAYPEHMENGEFGLTDPDGYRIVVGQPGRRSPTQDEQSPR